MGSVGVHLQHTKRQDHAGGVVKEVNVVRRVEDNENRRNSNTAANSANVGAEL